MMRFLFRLLLILLVVGGLFYVYTANRAGEFRSLGEPVALACESVSGMPGAEDITIDYASRTALVSSFDRARALADENVLGAIFALPLDGGAPRNLTADLDLELRPHGLSLLVPGSLREDLTQPLLFVINHPLDRSEPDRVEIFAWDGEHLAHQQTLSHPSFRNFNDLAAVDVDSFYATMDHGGSGAANTIEDYLGLDRAGVLYYNGGSATQVAFDLGYANGIALSREGRVVYVASSTNAKIHVFARDATAGRLEEVAPIDLPTHPDNLEIDRHGRLWIGAHPRLLTFARHASDPERLSPSEALWVDPDGQTDPPIRTVYLDPGDELSGSSVAAPFGDRILIGSVFEPHLLNCGYGR